MELEDAKIAQAYLLSEATDIQRALRINWARAGVGHVADVTSLPPVVTRGQSTTTTGSVLVAEKSQDSVNFLELPEGLLQALTPEIKVYKTYIVGDKEFDFQLRTGRIRAIVQGEEKTVELPVIKNVEFTRLGGNPAEINTNIKFNIKLYARDISSYFTRTSITDTGVIPDLYQIIDNLTAASIDPSTPAATAATNIETIEALRQQVAGFKDGISWIDLIKIDPGMAINQNTQLVTSEVECRIKVEVGYTMDPVASIPDEYVEKKPGDWEKWRASIIAQREVFNLSLFKHQFEFHGKKGVGLSVDFIASGNAKQLTPLADLFSNPAMNAEIEKRLESVKLKRAEKKTAGSELRGFGESMNERTRILEQCIETLKDDISTLQREIKEIRARIRVALLSQLYLDLGRSGDLAGAERTRIYYRSYIGSDEEGSPRNRDVEWNGIPEGRIESSGANITSADLASALGDDTITGTDSDGDRVEVDLEDISSRRVGSGRRADAYVFLGDIVEAAFEILMPGGAHTEVKRTQYNNRTLFWPGMTLVSVGGTYVFESPFTHNAGQGGTGFNSEIPNKERAERLINEFGGYFLGLVTYPDPLDPNEYITTSLSDLPISLDMFRGWWLNKYVSTAKRSLPIRDFLSALIRFVQEDVFRGIPYEEGSGEVPDDTPKFVINSVVPTQKLWNITYPPNWFKMRFNRVFVDRQGIRPSPLQKNTLTIVEQIDNALAIPEGTARIIFGETERGVLKKLTFEREDIPGHAEARMFSDRESMAGNIALREKYNTSMETLGTTAVLPGSLLYLDPKPLDLGYADQGESLAKSLGLGGLYRVVSLTSTLDFSGGGASWHTRLKTKWESFGDGTTGTAVSQLAGDISDCVEKATRTIATADRAETTRRVALGTTMCFVAGTKISMHDGTMKNIEDIVIGDTVLSWDEKTNEITRGNVSGLNQPLHDDMVNLTWGSITNKNTFDHPFYVKDKGWCSYAPDLTMERYSLFETVEKLETGDICYYNSGIELKEIRLSNIEEEIGITQTYIFSVETYDTFFANNILTHNKQM